MDGPDERSQLLKLWDFQQATRDHKHQFRTCTLTNLRFPEHIHSQFHSHSRSTSRATACVDALLALQFSVSVFCDYLLGDMWVIVTTIARVIVPALSRTLPREKGRPDGRPQHEGGDFQSKVDQEDEHTLHFEGWRRPGDNGRNVFVAAGLRSLEDRSRSGRLGFPLAWGKASLGDLCGSVPCTTRRPSSCQLQLHKGKLFSHPAASYRLLLARSRRSGSL